MAIRTILNESDEILYKKSRPVEAFDERLWTLLDDMAETMKSVSGVGLAAVQVGVLRRAVTIDVGEGVIELINPEIIAKKGKQEASEGCLSCPGQYGITKRPNFVRVKAQDRNGVVFSVKGEELLARALCHEIDHLDGIMFKQHVIRWQEDEE